MKKRIIKKIAKMMLNNNYLNWKHIKFKNFQKILSTHLWMKQTREIEKLILFWGWKLEINWNYAWTFTNFNLEIWH